MDGHVGKGVPGYVTPKVAVGAAVGNDRDEILLVQRADSGMWLYPTGWADVGYSAAEVVAKEVEEETGITVEVVRLIAVLDGLRIGISRIPLYSLVFQCRPVGGELRAHPLECSDVGWFALDDLPYPLAGAERWGKHVFAALRGEPIEVLYDSVRSPVWRGDPDAPDRPEPVIGDGPTGDPGEQVGRSAGRILGTRRSAAGRWSGRPWSGRSGMMGAGYTRNL